MKPTSKLWQKLLGESQNCSLKFYLGLAGISNKSLFVCFYKEPILNSFNNVIFVQLPEILYFYLHLQSILSWMKTFISTFTLTQVQLMFFQVCSRIVLCLIS